MASSNLELLVATVCHPKVPVDTKYSALHLIKDLMKQARPDLGQIFAERYLSNMMDLVMQESKNQGNGETLFLPNANPYGRRD